MELVFEQTNNRQQCGTEVTVNGFKVPCTFSSSTKVTIPTGLDYVDGNLCFEPNKLSKTFTICKNHEMQLNAAFQRFIGQKTING